jgi:peptidoglycan/xylan/chitin deacetylase (PgdA/CDA1 family)
MRPLADALVLCYHAVSEAWDADLSVTPERFEAQLRWLADTGYRAVTFTELTQRRMRGRVVAITFDDAFESVVAKGKPVLDAFGFCATMFAPTRFMEDGGPLVWPGIDHWQQTPHAGELTPLDWDGLAALRDAGWEIGSHTHTHPHLTTIPDDELRDELEGSRALCEERLGACTSIAYPYGDVDERVVAAAGRAGYSAGASLPARPHQVRALDWPRVGIYHRDSDARAARKMKPLTRAVQRSPAWPLIERAVRYRKR